MPEALWFLAQEPEVVEAFAVEAFAVEAQPAQALLALEAATQAPVVEPID